MRMPKWYRQLWYRWATIQFGSIWCFITSVMLLICGISRSGELCYMLHCRLQIIANNLCDTADDDLWIHPRDLPLPHEECTLCHQMVRTRQSNITRHQQAIAQIEDEIIEIEAGERHTAYHESMRARLDAEATP